MTLKDNVIADIKAELDRTAYVGDSPYDADLTVVDGDVELGVLADIVIQRVGKINFDWLTSNFDSDVDYTGAQVIGRLRMLEHALRDEHPAGAESCIICNNDAEGIE